MVEIRLAVLEKLPVKDERRTQVREWVQTRQRLSGMASPILVRFSHTEFIPARTKQRCFRKIPLFGRHV